MKMTMPPTSFVWNSRASQNSDPRPVRRRNRTVLACERCHQLKVKCDRRQPCRRCVSSGKAEECSFQSTSAPKQIATPPTSNDESPRQTDSDTSSRTMPSGCYSEGKARFAGIMHWAKLVREVKNHLLVLWPLNDTTLLNISSVQGRRTVLFWTSSRMGIDLSESEESEASLSCQEKPQLSIRRQ